MRKIAPHSSLLSPRQSEPLIRLDDVSLHFQVYRDKSRSLKRAVLAWLGRFGETHSTVEKTVSDVHTDSRFIDVQNTTSQFWALQNINLTVGAGTRLGIVGHNGAGKTTLLQVMAQIYRPTTGHLTIQGRVTPLLALGSAFNPELSAKENIRLHGALFGVDPVTMSKRSDAILEFADVTEFGDHPVKYFSSGMTSRLAFSIATDINPEILLIDEVFATGDRAFQKKASYRMESLMDTAHIVVMVTHNMSLIPKLCNRAIWVNQGHLVSDGEPDDVVEQYLAHIGQSNVQEKKQFADQKRHHSPSSNIAHPHPINKQGSEQVT